jgi:triphosphoribosyl-dephospho-CoA synthase
MQSPLDDTTAVVRGALDRIPASCARWGRGWCAAAACILEASVPKAGNVHPGRSFADLDHEDFVAAALAIAPVFDRAADAPLGATVRAAVAASAAVTRSNANLGIVLALAPLVALPQAAGSGADAVTNDGLDALWATLTPADAADVWEAIRLARPGGLGRSDRDDLAGPPPPDLRAAMAHAADRDQIAALWSRGYAGLLAGPVADLEREFAAGAGLADAIARGHLAQLARQPDSLIARRHGPAAAAEVCRQAAAIMQMSAEAWRPAAAAFDAALRMPPGINPGTTADLIATALYILLDDAVLRDRCGLSRFLDRLLDEP